MSTAAMRDQSASGPLSVERYIHFSTVWGIFSAVLVWHAGATIFLFYLVMLSNLMLIWALQPPVVLPRWLPGFLVYLLATGIVGTVRGTDSLGETFKQLGAISLSVFYFANFFHAEGNLVNRAWTTYIKAAYLFALIGILIWPVQYIYDHHLVRLQGMASEPAAFCLLTMPALYWYASQWLRFGKCRKETLWMALAVACSSSSIGYSALAVGLLLLFGKRFTGIVMATGLVAVLMVGIYLVSPDVRLRVDDTFGALSNNDVSATNVSTYALVSNMYVTGRVLAEHPILGNGLGSHVISSDRFVKDVPGEDLVEAAGWDAGFNTRDAASLTLRSLSELGILGFLGILWFIIHFRVKGESGHADISSAILTCFFQKLLRGGGYSNPEQFFFVLVYMLNYRQYHASLRDREYGLARSKS
ncbi:hypothetical protein AB4Y89_19270 [Terriglobus sp. 2YAB30_2]|uniref:hypothetical protein n=1 Tax=Terriglobus sp. 2YAB30_2 TaxID=3233023 RepID=UPI003F9A8E3D